MHLVKCPFDITQKDAWSLLDFDMKKVNFCCFSWGNFLCDVMSNHLQNHECNILPCTVSHVNKFNEVKGSNLDRIRPYLCFGQTNYTGSLSLRTQN